MLKVSLYSPLLLFQFWVINNWREEWRHGMTPGSSLLEQPRRCKALACFKVTLLKLGSLNLSLWFNSLYSCWAGLESCVTLVRLFDLGCVWLYDFCDLGDAVWPWTCATLGHAVWPRYVWPWKCVRPRTCCLYSTHMVYLHITRPILCLILYLTSGPRLQAEGCSSHVFNLCYSQGSTRPCALLSFCIYVPV